MTVKRWLMLFVRLLDAPVAILSIPCAVIFLLFRRAGAARLPLTREILRKIGIYPIRDHYYDPLFQPKYLRKDPSEARSLPGINFRVDEQLALLESMTFASELSFMTSGDTYRSGLEFRLNNGSFESGDAEFLYQFVRTTKPRTVVEIGSGNSTRIVQQALLANKKTDGVDTKHICIEPFEMPWLEQLEVKVIRRRVEDLPMAMFDQLKAGDLLFIDSSHIIRPQGDVLHEYLGILPSLATGVYVHVHDIFTPRDYLESWLREDVRFWNEQYLLEALLGHSSRYKVVAALNYLKHTHFNRLKVVCPFIDKDREPGSFYLRVA